jgi:purine-nucleoside phosphorylase
MTYQEIKNTAEYLQHKGIKNPETGIVLGTGLGKMVSEIKIEIEIEYPDIPNFPVATVESHSGKLIYGSLQGKKVLAMAGRFHYYEGYTFQEVTFPIRVMKLLGIQYLLLSNAAGAINLNFKKGTVMLINDHINLLPGNPLIGPNIDELGPRFPDLSQPYSKKMCDLIKTIAKKENVTLHEGVYVSVSGPNLETKAEYRFLDRIGADAVGMSTVPEVIVANHMSLPCAAVSVLTDECDPDNLKAVDIKEIIAIAGIAEKDMIKLFKGVIAAL